MTYCLYKSHFSLKAHRLKVKEWKKVFQAKGEKKQSQLSDFSKYRGSYQILRQNRLKTKNGKKRQRSLMIKGSTHQEEVTIVNICAPTWKHLNI